MKDLATCPICLDMLNDPVACLECSGTVCRNCRNINQLDININNNNNDADLTECTMCRTQAACKPSRETVRFLNTLRFHCAYRANGCDVQSIYSNLVAHIRACQHSLT